MACQGKTEARLDCKELTREEMESESEQREVPKERAAVMPVGGLRKWHRDRNLAAGRHQKPKETTWENCASQKGLTVTGREMTHRAKVARCKRHQGQDKDKVVSKTRKRLMLEKRHWLRQEGNNVIRSQDVEEPLHLRKGRKTANSIGGWNRRQQPRLKSMENGNKVFGITIGLGFGKRAFGISSRTQGIRDWSLWRGQPPPKRRKKLHTEQDQ
jgi:hypothetical protein